MKLKRIYIFLFLIITLLFHFRAPSASATTYAGYEGLTANDGTKMNALVGAPFPLGCVLQSYNAHLYCALPSPGNVTGTRDLPVDIVLSYSTGSAYKGKDTPYGYGWQLSYGISYRIEANDDVTITWGDGREDRFTRSGTSFIHPPGIHVTLEEYLSGKYRITMKHGVKIYFDGPHRMITSMVEPNGNTLFFTYSGDLLTAITEPSGKVVNLAYGVDGRLDSITDPAANTWTYNHSSGGDLLSITDPLGNTTTLGYDTAHRLKTITDAKGNTTTISYANFSGFGTVVRRIENAGTVWNFSYNYSSRTTTVTDTKGNQRQYTYDSYSNGRITQVRDPFGNLRQFTWDSDYNLTSYIDQNGTRTDMTYDPEGNLTSRIEAVGTGVQRRTDYTYTVDGLNNVASITEAVGTADVRATTYSYDLKGNLTGRCVDPTGLNLCTAYTYDSYGNRITMTNPRGVATNYEYTELGPNLTTTGNLTKTVLDPAGLAITTSYEHDAVGNQTKVIDPMGKVTCNLYDSDYRLIQTLRKVGDTTCPASLLTHPGAPAPYNDDIITQYTYDANGNRVTEKDPKGNITTYTYDNLDRVIGTTDALGNTSQTAYDSVGNRIKGVDPNNEVTCYKYDALRRNTQVIRIMAGNENMRDTNPATIDCETYIVDMNDAATSYTYDAVGNQLSTTDPNGNTTSYAYDALYRRTSETNPPGEITAYTYDYRGNQKTVTDPGGNTRTSIYDKADRVISISDSVGTVAGYTYDANGNRLTSTDGNGNGNAVPNTYDNADRLTIARDNRDVATQYTYDANGNQLSVTDRNGNVTCSTYDDLNRRSQIIQNIGDTSCAIDVNDIVTTYAYDKNSNQTQITDANGNTTSYAYDALNRLLTETYADLATRSFTYDNTGNMLTRLDQDGNTTSYTYDDLYRMKIRDYPGTNDDYFTYDAGGRMLTASNNDASISYAYDAANRTTSETLNGKTTGYSYDIPNRKRTITYPGGRVIEETRDLRQRLDTIKEGVPTIADYAYDAGDRTTARNLLNSVNASYTYNNNNWVTRVRHALGVSTRADFQYAFDNEGNRSSQEKLHDTSNSEGYSYDDIYRVTNYKQGTLSGGTIPSPSTQTQYNYDSLGNRTDTVTDAVTAPYASNNMNEYTSINGFAQTHDNRGNLTTDAVRTYSYDVENRLTSVDSGTTATYRYDPLGRRVQKVAGATTVNYYYDGSRIIEERDASDTVVATYVFGSWIDEVLQMVRGGNTYYYHQTSLGNIEAITNSSGAIVEAYRHDAYGIEENKPADATHPPTQKELTVLTGPGLDTTWFTGDDVIAAGSSIGNPYGYTGREYDKETGLYYYRARYYNATTGRFMQRDPLGYVDGMGLYEYVRGNGVNYKDPEGKTISRLSISLFLLFCDSPCPLIHGGLQNPIAISLCVAKDARCPGWPLPSSDLDKIIFTDNSGNKQVPVKNTPCKDKGCSTIGAEENGKCTFKWNIIGNVTLQAGQANPPTPNNSGICKRDKEDNPTTCTYMVILGQDAAHCTCIMNPR